MKFILAIDQGTTGTTAAFLNTEDMSFIGKVNQEFPQIYPSPGLVEHNLDDIWTSVETTILSGFKKFNLNPKNLLSIGITNQRETTCAFSKNGEALANGIVWQDRRTIPICEDLKKHENDIRELTGLPLDPYFSATKMKWFLNNNNQIKNSFEKDDLLFGTIDTYLLYKLTNGKSFKTDASNASRTLLMDLKSCEWNSKLLNIFNINQELLPEICDSFHLFGETQNLSFLPDGIPITGILGDQQAALFGQAGFKKGDMKCTYGTGAFLLLNTGNEISRSTNGLLTTVAYKNKNEIFYALEGSCYIAGAAVGWLRDNLKIIKQAKDIEDLAAKVINYKEMENLLFFPYFSGIGSPYWRPEAKAAIIGLSRDSENKHLALACLDGIALSINDLINAIKEDIDFELKSLKVDGGAVANNLLLKIQSTISLIEIVRPKVIETTAYGAALASAVGIGILEFNDIQKLWSVDSTFSEDENLSEHYNNKKTQWGNFTKKLYL